MRKTILLVLPLLSLVLVLSLSTAYASVEIQYFIGTWLGNRIDLEWETASELDHFGFHLWRSTEDLPVVNGQIDRTRAERLTSEPIVNPSGACTPSQSHVYTYTDMFSPPGEDVYYYYLESLDCQGGSEFSEDGKLTVERVFLVNFPLVMR